MDRCAWCPEGAPRARTRDHLLLLLPIALAILPPLARDAGEYVDIATYSLGLVVTLVGTDTTKSFSLRTALYPDSQDGDRRTIASSGFATRCAFRKQAAPCRLGIKNERI